jgi:tyrosine-protein kinase Etk/Wzc
MVPATLEPKNAVENAVPDLGAVRNAQEIDLLEVLLLLARHRRMIVRVTAFISLLALIVAFILPKSYTAKAVIMPPQQSQSTLSAFLGQIGALSGMSSKADFSLKNPSDLWVGMLGSQSIADALISRFHLADVYGYSQIVDARKKLGGRTDIAAGKEGLITIEVTDRDPNRAQGLANGYVEELYKLNARLVVSEAGQRRVFFESQLEKAHEELTAAEIALKEMQETTGLIQLDSQAKAIIEGVATLKAQIAAKEVQIEAMRSFATSRNPDLQLLERELGGLRAQQAKLEHNANSGHGDIQVGTQHVPEAALRYLRQYREVKYREMIFELLTKQFEAAKLDEARSAAVIQIVDRATVPEKRSGPPRLLIVAAGALSAFLLACLWALLLESLKTIARDPIRGLTLSQLKAHLKF